MYQSIKWTIQRISDEQFLDINYIDPDKGYDFYYSKNPGLFLDDELDATNTLRDLPDLENHRIVKMHLTIYKAL